MNVSSDSWKILIWSCICLKSPNDFQSLWALGEKKKTKKKKGEKDPAMLFFYRFFGSVSSVSHANSSAAHALLASHSWSCQRESPTYPKLLSIIKKIQAA